MTTAPGTSVYQALREASSVLSPSRTAALDAQLLLAEAMFRDRAWVLAHYEAGVPDDVLQQFRRLIARRRTGQPIAQITGRSHWYDLELQITPDVLIPRPETELLLERAREIATRVSARRVADIGTGSGALAIGLARCLPETHIDAVDISQEALDVAARNVHCYDLADQISLIRGSLIEPLEIQPDLIVANLPYLSDEMMEELDAEVRHEPQLALHGGSSGLELYCELQRMLTERGWIMPLVLEIDPRQENAVAALFQDADVSIQQDYSGRSRIVTVLRGLPI